MLFLDIRYSLFTALVHEGRYPIHLFSAVGGG